MTPQHRALIYWLFVAIFAVCAPLMIFYTMGYRYNWQRQRVEKVGVMIIDVKPSDANIMLNGQKITTSRPARLADLRPNYYQVRVEKSGYYSWQKNLEVKSQESVLLYDIVLFKERAPILINSLPNDLTYATENNTKNLYTLANGALMESEAVTGRAKKLDVNVTTFGVLDGDIYYTKNLGNKTLVYKYQSFNLFNHAVELASLPPGNYRLVSNKNGFLTLSETTANTIYLVNLTDTKQPLLRLSGNQAIWGLGTKNNYLYYYDNSEVWTFDPKTKQSSMLMRYNNDVRKILPIPNIPYFVIQLGNNLQIAELDDRDTRQAYTIFTGREINNLNIDKKGKELYFADKLKDTTGIFSLEIQ